MGDFIIDENTNVGELIKRFPEAVDILIDAGFTPLKNPVMRHMASGVSLRTASRIIHMSEKDFEKMMEKLREIVR